MEIIFKEDKKEEEDRHTCRVNLNENHHNAYAFFDITSCGDEKIEATKKMIAVLMAVKEEIDDAIKALGG